MRDYAQKNYNEAAFLKTKADYAVLFAHVSFTLSNDVPT